jgi:hypothetical protein
VRHEEREGGQAVDQKQYEIERVKPKLYDTTDTSENVMNWSHYNVGTKRK